MPNPIVALRQAVLQELLDNSFYYSQLCGGDPVARCRLCDDEWDRGFSDEPDPHDPDCPLKQLIEKEQTT